MTKNRKRNVTERSWLPVPRGQAMVEYSTVTFALLIGTGVALLPVLNVFYQALNTFYDSIYFILSSAVP